MGVLVRVEVGQTVTRPLADPPDLLVQLRLELRGDDPPLPPQPGKSPAAEETVGTDERGNPRRGQARRADDRIHMDADADAGVACHELPGPLRIREVRIHADAGDRTSALEGVQDPSRGSRSESEAVGVDDQSAFSGQIRCSPVRRSDDGPAPHACRCRSLGPDRLWLSESVSCRSETRLRETSRETTNQRAIRSHPVFNTGPTSQGTTPSLSVRRSWRPLPSRRLEPGEPGDSPGRRDDVGTEEPLEHLLPSCPSEPLRSVRSGEARGPRRKPPSSKGRDQRRAPVPGFDLPDRGDPERDGRQTHGHRLQEAIRHSLLMAR